MRTGPQTSLFEELIASTVETCKDIPTQIAVTGKIALSRSQINMQIGELFILRINIHLNGSVLDTPELFWVEPQLEPVYQAVRSYLEMDQRVGLLTERLDVIADLLAVLKDQLSHGHGEKLEWIGECSAFNNLCGLPALSFYKYIYLGSSFSLLPDPFVVLPPSPSLVPAARLCWYNLSLRAQTTPVSLYNLMLTRRFHAFLQSLCLSPRRFWSLLSISSWTYSQATFKHRAQNRSPFSIIFPVFFFKTFPHESVCMCQCAYRVCISLELVPVLSGGCLDGQEGSGAQNQRRRCLEAGG